MDRRTLAINLLALILPGLAPGTPSAQTMTCETSDLTLIERHLHDAIVDVGYPDQDSVGDLMIWANKVFDHDNSEQLGDVNGWCTRTAVGRAWECTFTLLLAEGRITAAGTALDDEDSVFAVIGGTGEYFGVGGQVTIQARGRGGLNRYDYELRQCR